MSVMVFFGRTLYGMVDRVPGYCHVKTLFWHFCFIPMFPFSSFLIVEGRRGEEDRAYPIRRSWKSIFFTAVRTLLVFAFLITAGPAVDRLVEDRPGHRRSFDSHEIQWGLFSLGVLAAFAGTYPLSRPLRRRRDYLLKLVEKADERERQLETAERNRRRKSKPKPPHPEEPLPL